MHYRIENICNYILNLKFFLILYQIVRLTTSEFLIIWVKLTSIETTCMFSSPNPVIETILTSGETGFGEEEGIFEIKE